MLGSIDMTLGLADEMPDAGMEFMLHQSENQLMVGGLPDHQDLELHVYDLKGKWLMSGQSERQSSLSIDTSALPTGAYLLQVLNPRGKTVGSQKFLKTGG